MDGQSISMNPDLVYNLVAANPSLRNLVEQTAKLQQLQQMAQNPMGAVNGLLNWQPQQAPQQMQQQNSQGGQPMGMLEQAMGIVGEFRKSFEVMNNNLKEVYDMCAANAEAIKALCDRAGEPAAKSKSVPKSE